MRFDPIRAGPYHCGMFDLLITNGTVVDGTGADRRIADIAITDGRIVAVGTDLGEAHEIIDAQGLLVTPGFVDVHSHYDGQATWDELLEPSSLHGVTTLVMGNCGVGFAPVKPGTEEWLIQLMEGVEDIPGTALSEGIDFTWESFPEYLDALDERRWSVDVGAQVAHGAVRAYVMGERGAKNEAADPDDIEQMATIVRQAIEAGALGVSTSRTIAHTAMDGEPVPGTFAAEDELFAMGRALRDGGGGVFELAPAGTAGLDLVAPMKEVEWMSRLSAETGQPVTFAMLQVPGAPDLWKEQMQASLEARETEPSCTRRSPGVPSACSSDGKPVIRSCASRRTRQSPNCRSTSESSNFASPTFERRSSPRTTSRAAACSSRVSAASPPACSIRSSCSATRPTTSRPRIVPSSGWRSATA